MRRVATGTVAERFKTGIYSPTGPSSGDGRACFRREPARWSRDVELFLARWM